MALFNQTKRPFDSETLTVSNSVKQLTSSKYNNTGGVGPTFNLARKAAGVVIENTSANAVRYTEDGTTPVAGATGKLLNQADTLILESYEAIVRLKMIRDSGGDATIDVEYFR